MFIGMLDIWDWLKGTEMMMLYMLWIRFDMPQRGIDFGSYR